MINRSRKSIQRFWDTILQFFLLLHSKRLRFFDSHTLQISNVKEEKDPSAPFDLPVAARCTWEWTFCWSHLMMFLHPLSNQNQSTLAVRLYEKERKKAAYSRYKVNITISLCPLMDTMAESKLDCKTVGCFLNLSLQGAKRRRDNHSWRKINYLYVFTPAPDLLFRLHSWQTQKKNGCFAV